MRMLALLTFVVGLVVDAAVPPAAQATATSTATGTATTATMPSTTGKKLTTTGNNSTESPVTELSLFPVSDPSPPPLKVGFSVVNDNEFGFAAYVDGEFVGGTEFLSLTAGSIADGYVVPVEANVTGEHQATVYAVRDSNGNGVVDAEDEPYTRDGDPVKTTGTFRFDPNDGGVSNLAFYVGHDDPRPIQVGYTVEKNTTVAVALLADGEMVGHTAYRQYEERQRVDRVRVPHEANFTGEVELAVVALRDSNGNGEVDDGDEPYRDDGQRVASTLTFDFGGGTTDSETTTPDDGTSTSTTTGRTGRVPGFGLFAAGAAFAAVLLATRQRS